MRGVTGEMVSRKAAGGILLEGKELYFPGRLPISTASTIITKFGFRLAMGRRWLSGSFPPSNKKISYIGLSLFKISINLGPAASPPLTLLPTPRRTIVPLR